MSYIFKNQPKSVDDKCCNECKNKIERNIELQKIVDNLTIALDKVEKTRNDIPDSIRETAKEVINNTTRSHVRAAKKLAEYLLSRDRK